MNIGARLPPNLTSREDQVQWHWKKTENQALASRLISAADAITNKAASGLERDLRAAAAIITGESAEPTQPLMSRVISELARIANHTADADTQRRIRRLIGEAQS